MKSIKRLFLSIVLIPVLIAAGEPQGIKYPHDGNCDEHYSYIEGVCIHATQMRADAEELRKVIEHFKATGKLLERKLDEIDNSNLTSDQKRCLKYKQSLNKYLTEGVMGINLATGKLVKMKGEEAEMVIQSARENVEIFCEEN